MSARMVRIELRRSSALATGTAIFVITVALLYLLSNGPWQKSTGAWHLQWDSFVYYLRFMHFVLLPVALGGGALLGMRDRRSHVQELFASAPRPAWQRSAHTAVAVCLAMVAASAAILVAGGVSVVANGGFFHLGWLPVAAVGALSLVAAGWLGMGVGRLLPSLLTPPVVAAAGFAVLTYAHSTTISAEAYDAPRSSVPELLTPMLAGTTRNAFIAVSGTVSAVQLVWFAAVATTALGLLTASRLGTRIAVLLPAALGIAVAVTALPRDAEAVYVINEEATALVCTETGDVCVTRAHADKLDALTGPARDALSRLGRLPDAPKAVAEIPTRGMDKTTRHVPPGVLPLDFDELELADEDSTSVRIGLLSGTDPGCDTWYGDESQAARTIIASWFVDEFTPLPDYSGREGEIRQLAEPAWQALRALPPEAQPQEVAELRATTQSCQPDPLAVLAPGA
ncbi:hypothetical protein AB0I53_12315 [Saccharopolyspora sp. NPDC050389]|uniref:hypothetical protein n=1 Tax=Saccharopolyspora sp. NPDC050389 TaxID=3155516 RepID=UPI0033E9EB28